MARTKMTGEPKRPVGRPPEAVLDRDRITAAALKVLKRTGPDKFTMAALAEDMGVKTPALYNHVRGKADVLAGMREHISDEIQAGAFVDMPWYEAVVPWAHSYRNALPPTRTLLRSWRPCR